MANNGQYWTMKVRRIPHLIICLPLFLLCITAYSNPASTEFPEQELIDAIRSGDEPEGVVFLVMEHDEEAYSWVLPRVLHYTKQLRETWPELSIVVLSHGDEMFALRTDYRSLYEQLHRAVEVLVEDYHVTFQVCGSYAFFSDVDASEFPKFVDVVPYAPSEIENYRMMEYRMLNLELTW